MQTPAAVPRPLAGIVFLALVLAVLPGCGIYLPDQQSARLLPEGEWEVTPGFSSVTVSDEGESEHVQNQLGVNLGYGVSERLEWRLNYQHIWIDEDVGEGNVNILGGGPKFGGGEGTVAFYLPVGFVFGEDVEVSETWTVAPTLLVTWQPSPTVQVNPSVKAIYPFASEDPELLLGFNLGLGLAAADGRVVVRPEAGLVINPGDDGVFWGWTIGASLRP